ncbi:MAG: dual specificity protein phosphatase, partial [Phenylobacterium sp.]|nr:dual specificity protein phosphatase [Phenylobacterium sp.]
LAVGGSFPCGKAASLAADHGVGAVVDLRAETCDNAAELSDCGLRFLHLPTPDTTGVTQDMLDVGVEFAGQAAADGLKVLIHCEHGIGRSATLALCLLAQRGVEPLAALAMAKGARALISPSQSQYEAWAVWLARHEQAPPSYHEFGMIAYRHLAQQA